MRRLLFSLAFASASTAANADIIGTLQEQFSCPQADCETSCLGPGGPQVIKDYNVLSAFALTQPDRLWLDLDNKRIIVLGTADRCTFAGTPIPISGPGLPPVRLDPVSPQCTCFNNNCSPPGCNRR